MKLAAAAAATVVKLLRKITDFRVLPLRMTTIEVKKIEKFVNQDYNYNCNYNQEQAATTEFNLNFKLFLMNLN